MLGVCWGAYWGTCWGAYWGTYWGTLRGTYWGTYWGAPWGAVTFLGRPLPILGKSRISWSSRKTSTRNSLINNLIYEILYIYPPAT